MSEALEDRLSQLSPQKRELFEKLSGAGELTPAKEFQIFHRSNQVLSGGITSLRSIPCGGLRTGRRDKISPSSFQQL
ncbi:MAG TPA: hypothetical protein VH640_15000 [Bryobacteraceae bacterium]|jgi:hypothetical protein